MDSSPIKVGIIGFGNIGQIHSKVLAHHKDARVVAIATRHPARLSTTDKPPVEVYADYRELLMRSDVDLVSVCTPSGQHAAQALDALAAGKHVVVEKPLAMDLASGNRMVQTARERELFLSVISQRRLEPQNLYLKGVLDDGSLGRPVLGEALLRWYRDQSYYDSADWRGTTKEDGGVLMNQGIHLIDLLRWYMGPTTEVSGTVSTLTHRMEAEDTGVATLRFTSGALGIIAATTSAPPGLPEELNLFFEEGSVSVHGSQVARWEVPNVPPPPSIEVSESGAVDPTAIGAQGHLRQWEDIIDALQTGREPAVTGEEALASLAVVLDVYESARSARAVRPEQGASR